MIKFNIFKLIFPQHLYTKMLWFIFIILLIVGIYFVFFKEGVSKPLKFGIFWFVFLVELNILNLIYVLDYYKENKIRKGAKGPPGDPGPRGFRGKMQMCSSCDQAGKELEVKYAKNEDEQGNTISDNNVMPVGSIKKCVFPFIYDYKTRYEPVTDIVPPGRQGDYEGHKEKGWCATKIDAQMEPLEYGFSIDNIDELYGVELRKKRQGYIESNYGILDVKIVAGNTVNEARQKCEQMPGYRFNESDMNAGTGGKFVHMCYKQGLGDTGISNLHILSIPHTQDHQETMSPAELKGVANSLELPKNFYTGTKTETGTNNCGEKCVFEPIDLNMDSGPNNHPLNHIYLSKTRSEKDFIQDIKILSETEAIQQKLTTKDYAGIVNVVNGKKNIVNINAGSGSTKKRESRFKENHKVYNTEEGKLQKVHCSDTDDVFENLTVEECKNYALEKNEEMTLYDDRYIDSERKLKMNACFKENGKYYFNPIGDTNFDLNNKKATDNNIETVCKRTNFDVTSENKLAIYLKTNKDNFYSIDSAFVYKDNSLYILRGNSYYKMKRMPIGNILPSEDGYPKSMALKWTGGSSTSSNNDINIKCSDVKTDQCEPGNDECDKCEQISHCYWDIINGKCEDKANYDAVFTYGKNNKTYFFKGGLVYEYDDKNMKMTDDSPKTIDSVFKGVPNNIDAAFTWSKDKQTYFFKGKKYYKYDDKLNKIASGYPKRTIKRWEMMPSMINAIFSLPYNLENIRNGDTPITYVISGPYSYYIDPVTDKVIGEKLVKERFVGINLNAVEEDNTKLTLNDLID